MEEPRTTHETVGWRFKSFGATYRCTRYVRSQGFWMRVLEISATRQLIGRQIGEDACVSERAIGRTYHRIYDDDLPEPHEMPCECYVCSAPTLAVREEAP